MVKSPTFLVTSITIWAIHTQGLVMRVYLSEQAESSNVIGITSTRDVACSTRLRHSASALPLGTQRVTLRFGGKRACSSLMRLDGFTRGISRIDDREYTAWLMK